MHDSQSSQQHSSLAAQFSSSLMHTFCPLWIFFKNFISITTTLFYKTDFYLFFFCFFYFCLQLYLGISFLLLKNLYINMLVHNEIMYFRHPDVSFMSYSLNICRDVLAVGSWKFAVIGPHQFPVSIWLLSSKIIWFIFKTFHIFSIYI